MKRFAHISVQSTAQAIALLDPRTRPLAGGTELVSEMKDGLQQPERLISLRQLHELRGIQVQPGAGLVIGALTTLRELERSAELSQGPYAALAQAAGSAASPQLRNLATLGGNLLQDSRCWYYRGPLRCWLKGGEECLARSGEHHTHMIFEQSECAAVHPSDPATALLALGAQIRLAGPDGQGLVGLPELLRPPGETRRRFHALGSDELILAIELPELAGWRSVYHKAMERATYAFALAGVAVALRLEQGLVAEARIALGGIANTPILATAAAERLIGGPLESAQISAAAEQAVAGAAPLPQTAYKLELVRRMLGAALEQLARE